MVIKGDTRETAPRAFTWKGSRCTLSETDSTATAYAHSGSTKMEAFIVGGYLFGPVCSIYFSTVWKIRYSLTDFCCLSDYLYEYVNRSGFTPPANLSPGFIPSPDSYAQISRGVDIVRNHLGGYSLEELHDLGAMDTSNKEVGENTLTNEILPLLTCVSLSKFFGLMLIISRDYWLTPGPPDAWESWTLLGFGWPRCSWDNATDFKVMFEIYDKFNYYRLVRV